ncbi:MAG TPA: hypothetical protein VGY76_02625 [Solirubrobacteraceae bacterium]|jgi:hypothetical protein|nr:hypothetical protein [Solirubrobacteraceae bacterium]
MSVLACSGHLLIDLPIFMGPVVVLVGWLSIMTRRGRRQEEARPTGAARPTKLPEGRLSV